MIHTVLMKGAIVCANFLKYFYSDSFCSSQIMTVLGLKFCMGSLKFLTLYVVWSFTCHTLAITVQSLARSEMGKLKLSVQRKNYRRKKCDYLPVRISLRSDIDFLKVTIPLDQLSYKVSLPLSAYVESPASSLLTLQNRIKEAKLFPQCFFKIHHDMFSVIQLQRTQWSTRLPGLISVTANALK